MSDGMEDIDYEIESWRYEDTRTQAMVIIAKISGFFSIIGSLTMIIDLLCRNRSKNLSMIRNRILLLFSFGDLSHTFFGHFLGT